MAFEFVMSISEYGRGGCVLSIIGSSTILRPVKLVFRDICRIPSYVPNRLQHHSRCLYPERRMNTGFKKPILQVAILGHARQNLLFCLACFVV